MRVEIKFPPFPLSRAMHREASAIFPSARRFCQASREENRYFSTAPRIQDGRVHVDREDSPFPPLHAPRSLAPLPASLSSLSRLLLSFTPHISLSLFFSLSLSLSLPLASRIFSQLSTLPCVAMPVLSMRRSSFFFSFFFFFLFFPRAGRPSEAEKLAMEYRLSEEGARESVM